MAEREWDAAERKEIAPEWGTIATIVSDFIKDFGVMVALVPLKPPITLTVMQEEFSPLTDKPLLCAAGCSEQQHCEDRLIEQYFKIVVNPEEKNITAVRRTTFTVI